MSTKERRILRLIGALLTMTVVVAVIIAGGILPALMMGLKTVLKACFPSVPSMSANLWFMLLGGCVGWRFRSKVRNKPDAASAEVPDPNQPI